MGKTFRKNLLNKKLFKHSKHSKHNKHKHKNKHRQEELGFTKEQSQALVPIFGFAFLELSLIQLVPHQVVFTVKLHDSDHDEQTLQFVRDTENKVPIIAVIGSSVAVKLRERIIPLAKKYGPVIFCVWDSPAALEDLGIPIFDAKKRDEGLYEPVDCMREVINRQMGKAVGVDIDDIKPGFIKRDLVERITDRALPPKEEDNDDSSKKNKGKKGKKEKNKDKNKGTSGDKVKAREKATKKKEMEARMEGEQEKQSPFNWKRITAGFAEDHDRVDAEIQLARYVVRASSRNELLAFLGNSVGDDLLEEWAQAVDDSESATRVYKAFYKMRKKGVARKKACDDLSEKDTKRLTRIDNLLSGIKVKFKK